MSSNTPISGFVARGFEGVHFEFEENFRSRGEVGASVHVRIKGEVVVDLRGGWANPLSGEEWAPDTLVNVYSVGKAFVALAALQQVDRGLLTLDEPLARIWPEFATGGKERATLRMALCHQAGVPAIGRLLRNADLSNWTSMVTALEETPAWFEPGSQHMYHTNTYGHLIGEIVRRTTEERPGAYLRELTSSLEADVFVGLREGELERCADVQFVSDVDPTTIDLDAISGDQGLVMRSYFNPPGYSSFGLVNTRAWREAEIPSTNTHATAEGIAKIYEGLLTPGRLLSPELLKEATSIQSEGPCKVLGEHATFGLGFTPTTERRAFGPNPGSFGHFGTGGALGFADPIVGLSFGYAMNHVIPRWQSTRNHALRVAVYEAVASNAH
ncbi:MAG: serine hydrolase domain-containing protein [Actinomycetota bacterium]